MDFHALMSIASTKQERKDKEKVKRYSLDLAPAKKEEKSAVNSDAVKKLKKEKEKERHKAEKAARKERENQAPEEKKANSFRIPKKKAEAAADRETFINSLFDDSTLSDEQAADESNHVKSSHSTSSSSKTSSSSHSNSHSSSSSKSKERSSGSSHKSSHSSSNHHESKSHSKSEGSSRREDKSSSEDSKHHSKSSSKSHSSSHSKSQSSSSSSSSSSSKSKPLVSSSSSKSSKSVDKSSSSNPSSQSASSRSQSSSTSSSASNIERKPSDERPIALSKHHLNPVAERQATNPYLSEKEKILAHLQTVRERTKAAIIKETSSKGKRARNEKGSRRTKEEEKEDDRVKSKAFVREDVSSSDDEVPDALGIMLSERNARLEKEKITRMAKQAWERAMKKDKGDSVEETKPVKKRRSRIDQGKMKPVKSHKQENQSPTHSHRTKGRAHSLSPSPGGELKRQPVKPKIVRHAGSAVPPPMDFQALLAMAEKKQHEPAKQERTIPKKKKKEKEERPMTQEEKERHERIKTKEYQNWLKYGGKQPKDKKNDELDDDDDLSDTSSPQQQSQSKDKAPEAKKKVPAGGDKPSAYAKYVERQNSKVSVASRTPVGNIPRAGRNITVNENVLVCGSTEGSEVDSPSPQAKAASENPFDRLLKQVHKKKPKVPSDAKKRRIEDSEYEEDDYSDMDDFIDDGNDADPDYSKEIKNIFGYDKSRYRYEDDDVSDMEADFSTIMKEEKHSAKIGRMEDLEDMKREEEELRRKALLKKKMKK